MNKKFFLFKREDPEYYHGSKSDTGNSLSILCLPSDNLGYMTASKGVVRIVFNDSTPYEESSLTDGESFEKTEVSVSCQEGREQELMESVMNFISRTTSEKNIMYFDALDLKNTFPEVKGGLDLMPKVRANPIKRSTGEPSSQSFLGVDNTSGALTPLVTSIAGIDFKSVDNLPVIDFNEVVLESKNYSADATITHWDNDPVAVPGAGNTFDLHEVGTPKYREASSWCSTPYADFNDSTTANYFKISSGSSTDETLTEYKDFTMYMVLGLLPGNAVNSLYSDTATTGTSGPFPSVSAGSEFFFNFSNSTTDLNLGYSSKSAFPGAFNASLGYISDNSLHVFIIRRDSLNDIFVYDKNGKIVASIDAPHLNEPGGSTDGQLVINRIGGALGFTKMKMVRFGLVEKDLGNDFCAGLGPTLYNRYKV